MRALARSAASAYDRHAHGDHGYAQAAGAGIRGGAHGGTMPELQAVHLHGGARTRTATQSAPQGILSRQQWRLSTRQSPGSARAFAIADERHLGYTTGHTGHLGNPPRPRGYVGFFSSFLSLAMVNRPSRAGSHQRATLDARRPSHLPRGPRRAWMRCQPRWRRPHGVAKRLRRELDAILHLLLQLTGGLLDHGGRKALNKVIE